MPSQIVTDKYEKLVVDLCSKDTSIYGQDLSAKWTTDHIDKAKNGYQTITPLLDEINKSGKKIKMLDLCCGWGEYVVNFCSKGIDCFGIDISADPFKGLTLARENGLPPHFIQGSVDDLPLRSNIFDIACSFSALEHIKSPQKMFNNVYRILKPGGFFFITFPNPLRPVDGHTLLRFVPYLPHKMAELYVKLRKKRLWNDNWDVWYHKQYQVYSWARKAGFKNIIVYPPNRFIGTKLTNSPGYKKRILNFANLLNINISKYWNCYSNMTLLLMEKSDNKNDGH